MSLGDDIQKRMDALAAKKAADSAKRQSDMEKAAADNKQKMADALAAFLADDYLRELIFKLLDMPNAGTKFGLIIDGKNFRCVRPTPGKDRHFQKSVGGDFAHGLNFPTPIVPGQLSEATNRARVSSLAKNEGIIVSEFFEKPTGPVTLQVDVSKLKAWKP